jgi:hypothetical protein
VLDPAETTPERAAVLIAGLRFCPIGGPVHLGRTLHAWRHELCDHFDHPDVSNGPTENNYLKNPVIG